MDAAPTATAAPVPRNLRKTYVVDRGFQLKYTVTLAGIGALISLLFGGLMYLAHLDAERLVNPQQALSEQLSHADATLLWLLACVTVMMACAFALFGVLVTHRVAGPVFVMSHYIQVLAKGRYPMMRPLRKHDELQAFFHQFQIAVEAMRNREVEEADALRDAVLALEPLASSPKAQEAVARLQAIHDRKRDATDRLNLGRGSAAPGLQS
jgi:hypothetical protein